MTLNIYTSREKYVVDYNQQTCREKLGNIFTFLNMCRFIMGYIIKTMVYSRLKRLNEVLSFHELVMKT